MTPVERVAARHAHASPAERACGCSRVARDVHVSSARHARPTTRACVRARARARASRPTGARHARVARDACLERCRTTRMCTIERRRYGRVFDFLDFIGSKNSRFPGSRFPHFQKNCLGQACWAGLWAGASRLGQGPLSRYAINSWHAHTKRTRRIKS